MTSMALKQATGMPSGNHGLFHRFGIEAVTIESTAEPVAAAEAVIAEAAASETEAAPAEPVLVEVWRPGGRSEDRRPRHDRSRYKGPDKSAAAEGEVVADGAGLVVLHQFVVVLLRLEVDLFRPLLVLETHLVPAAAAG